MTLTLRDIPHDLDAALQKQAREQHTTVDQVAVEAMKAGLGLPSTASNGRDVNLAASIRDRVAALGGIELAQQAREPIRKPVDFDE